MGREFNIILNIVPEPIVESVVKRKMKTKKIEITQDTYGIKHTDREEELTQIGFSFSSINYTTVVGPFDIEDLKLLRKLIRKEIRRIQTNENNKSV